MLLHFPFFCYPYSHFYLIAYNGSRSFRVEKINKVCSARVTEAANIAQQLTAVTNERNFVKDSYLIFV